MKRSRTQYSGLDTLGNMPRHYDILEEKWRSEGSKKCKSYPQAGYEPIICEYKNSEMDKINFWEGTSLLKASGMTGSGTQGSEVAISLTKPSVLFLSPEALESRASLVNWKAPQSKVEEEKDSVILSENLSKISLPKNESHIEVEACTSVEDFSDSDKSFDREMIDCCSLSSEASKDGSCCSGCSDEESEGPNYF